jgi:multiple antibiotic resistance protein
MLGYNEYLQIAIGVFAILSPFSAIPIFLSLTAGQDGIERKKTAITASIATALTMIISVWLGETILNVFGISIPSFRVAGGILLLLMSINMINAQVPRQKNTPEELEEAIETDKAIAIVPLAIPLLAGPGAISTVILYSHQANGTSHLFIMSFIITFVVFLIFLALRMAVPLSKTLGKTGINIISRIMGLILAAIAIEFITSGLIKLFPGWA